VADLKITFTDGSGSLTATLSSAGWGPIGRSISGMTSIKRYNVTGGSFTVSTSGGGTSGGVTGGLNTIDGGSIYGSSGALPTAGSYDGGNLADNMALAVAVDGGTF
jgi:hypothetical protein